MWRNHDISTESSNPNQSFFDSGAFIGSYNGFAVGADVRYPLWTDGRNTPGSWGDRESLLGRGPHAFDDPVRRSEKRIGPSIGFRWDAGMSPDSGRLVPFRFHAGGRGGSPHAAARAGVCSVSRRRSTRRDDGGTGVVSLSIWVELRRVLDLVPGQIDVDLLLIRIDALDDSRCAVDGWTDG
jgi:hypothetical protein